MADSYDSLVKAAVAVAEERPLRQVIDAELVDDLPAPLVIIGHVEHFTESKAGNTMFLYSKKDGVGLTVARAEGVKLGDPVEIVVRFLDRRNP